MFIVWILVGVALGYLFKPQLDKGVKRITRMIKDNRSDKGPTY
jgi:hypothetical protein